MTVSLRIPRVVVLLALASISLLTSCAPPPDREVLIYDGGSLSGDLRRRPDRYSMVAIDRFDSPMGKATTIQLSDGVPISMAHVTPDFLLHRGRVFVPREGEREGTMEGFKQLHGLSAFDPAVRYAVIVGPTPYGPFYRFDVVGGKAVAMGAEWVAQLLDDGTDLRPGPVFVDLKGNPRTLPFTPFDVEAIWGEPIRVERTRVGAGAE